MMSLRERQVVYNNSSSDRFHSPESSSGEELFAEKVLAREEFEELTVNQNLCFVEK
jgi:hypothetical protein